MKTLRELPLSAKALITAFLVSMGLNHGFAGLLSYYIGNSAAGGEKEHFQYKDIVYLLRMSHQHAFGHGVMYTVLGAIFLLSTLPERLKTPLILLPFLGAGLDLAAWWLQKYAAADYEWLSIAGGILFSVGFTVMSVRIFWELWFSKGEQTA
jgi:hypothetical protein